MKQLFVSVTGVLFLFQAHSQVRLDVKSGLNIATTKGLIAYPINRLGWYGGASARFPLGLKSFFQPELLYSSKGDKAADEETWHPSLRLNYLTVPLLLGYAIDQKTSVVLGPELGYLLNARFVIDPKNNIDVTAGHPPRLDVGAALGLQYQLQKKVSLEARYLYGFNTLYSVDAVGERYTDQKGANRVFQLGARYRLH